MTDSPGINIDRDNRASIVHRDPAFDDGKHVLEDVTLWNALAGSAQIITNGVKTIPDYKDATHPDELLTPNGTYTRGGRHCGGSTTMAMQDPADNVRKLVNSPSDNPPRAEGGNFAVYSDGVLPVTAAVASPPANANGWNNTNVT